MVKKIVSLSLLFVLLSLSSCQNSSSSSSAAASSSEAASSSASSSVEEVNYDLQEGLSYSAVSANDKLDAYIPKTADGSNVGVIFVHGGAFKFGDTKMFQNVGKWLGNHGYAAFTINYRLNTDGVFPHAVSDVKGAIRYVRANASTFKINPDKIVVAGESAGAYLAVMAGANGGTTTFDGDVSENLTVSSKVKAVVDFYGPIDFYTIYADATKAAQSPESAFCGFNIAEDKDKTYTTNPVKYLTENFTSAAAPYFYITHGLADTTIPSSQSQYLYDQVTALFGTSAATLSLKEGLAHMDGKFYTSENLTSVFADVSSHL